MSLSAVITSNLLLVLLVDVLAVLVDGVTLQALVVEGVLGTWFDFAVDKGTSEAGHELFGTSMGLGLT